MSLDRKRLEEALNEMGYEVEFDSSEPGIHYADGTQIKLEDIPNILNIENECIKCSNTLGTEGK